MQTLYPLQFIPVYKQYVWGGKKLREIYRRVDAPSPCSEAWEVADRDDGMSIVSAGPLRGTTLRQLMEERGEEIAGSRWKRNAKDLVFPVLVKIIDAGERLSIQVHPDEESARRYGGEPKTEMWYVLDAEPEAYVYAGFNRIIDTAALERSLKDGSIESILNKIPLKIHTAIYVPGGRVHAIGGGCLLLEIQQNSNTTYRLYDWNRVDKSGKSRPLHIEQAIHAIRWHDDSPLYLQPVLQEKSQAHTIWEILTCPYFSVKRIELSDGKEIKHNGESCHIVFVVSGRVNIEGGLIPASISAGTTSLIPAGMKRYIMSPVSSTCVLLDITLV
jgi:mannose-6-phosphate isomerase